MNLRGRYEAGYSGIITLDLHGSAGLTTHDSLSIDGNLYDIISIEEYGRTYSCVLLDRPLEESIGRHSAQSLMKGSVLA